MKPVTKGAAAGPFSAHGHAKPELIRRLGQHCSYCEQYGAPQNLDVEHIYPFDPHPELRTAWENFLLSCKSCNTYKHKHLKSDRQVNLEGRFVWPHLDNTINAFQYFDDGTVEVSPNLAPEVAALANQTMEMTGIMCIPDAAAAFEPDIPYSAMSKRREMWEIAQLSRQDYLRANGLQSPASLAREAYKMGYFSIWMEIFNDRPEVRHELIQAFKADPGCFNADTQPIPKGRL